MGLDLHFKLQNCAEAKMVYFFKKMAARNVFVVVMFVLTISVGLTFTGCGGSGDGDSDTTQNPANDYAAYGNVDYQGTVTMSNIDSTALQRVVDSGRIYSLYNTSKVTGPTIEIVSLSTGEELSIISGVALSAFSVVENILYAVDSDDTLLAFDVSNIEKIEEIGSVVLSGIKKVHYMCCNDNHLFIAGQKGRYVVNMADPTSMVLTYSETTDDMGQPQHPDDFYETYQGGELPCDLMIAKHGDVYCVYDISTPYGMDKLYTWTLDVDKMLLRTDGDYIYTSDMDTLEIYEVLDSGCPNKLVEIGESDGIHYVKGFWACKGYLIVGGRSNADDFSDPYGFDAMFYDVREPLGYILIDYLSTDGDTNYTYNTSGYFCYTDGSKILSATDYSYAAEYLFNGSFRESLSCSDLNSGLDMSDLIGDWIVTIDPDSLDQDDFPYDIDTYYIEGTIAMDTYYVDGAQYADATVYFDEYDNDDVLYSGSQPVSFDSDSQYLQVGVAGNNMASGIISSDGTGDYFSVSGELYDTSLTLEFIRND